MKRFVAYAWCVLVFAVAVVLWGAGVRATGSGAGCGDQWPLCKGVWLPPSPQLQTIIEFTHRITSGPMLGLLIAGMAVFAFVVFPRRHPVRRFAVLSILFTVTEALIGAALVLLGHVGTNESPNRAWTLGIHLINTMVLLAVIALTAWFANSEFANHGFANHGFAGHDTDSPEQIPERPVSPVLLRCALAAFLVISVTGAIAALSDTLFHPASLSEGFRQDFSPSAHIFLRLRFWHPIVALLCGIGIAAFALEIVIHKRSSAAGRKLAAAVACLVVTQAGVGAANILLLTPVWMQLTHLFVADLLWISIVLMSAEMGLFGHTASSGLRPELTCHSA